MSEYRDLIQQAVTNTPGTTGSFTLGSAASGMRALQLSDHGKQFDLMITQAGLGTEVRRGCIYSHSGTTITRGTLLTSTTGSALNFTSSAVVRVTMPAKTLQSITNSLSASASVQKNMLTQGGIDLQPIPARTIPFKRDAGTIYYIDPTVVGPGAGTYADPWKAVSSLPVITAGQSVLFKAGTTTVITSTITVYNKGTSTNPIIFGVYLAFADFTGQEMIDKRSYGTPGAATIDCGGNSIGGLDFLGDIEYICVDGLRIINNSGANNLIRFQGDIRNCQILNCVTSNPSNTSPNAHIYIWTTSSVGGNIVEGNQCSANIAVTDSDCLAIKFTAAESIPTRIQFNRLGGANRNNLSVWDGYETLPWNGIIACNTIDNSAGRLDTNGGIYLICSGGSPKIFRNVSRRNKCGLEVASSRAFVTQGSSFSGLLIENNDFSNNMFNVALSGVYGPWTIQYNRLIDAGSKDGTTWVTTERYGRNIELYGVNDSMACRGGIVRFNYCSGAYNWNGSAGAEGSEGTGIGIDDRTRDTLVYGNYCINNEGSGIQINQGRNVHVFGNICVDNSNLRPGRTTVIRDMDRAEIAFVFAKACLVFNNTLVSTKRATQRYSISEAYAGAISTDTKFFNNLCIGASVAGIRLDVSGTSAVEYNNLIIDAPVLVKDIADADTTPGAGTIFGSAADYSAETPYYLPTPGGLADKNWCRCSSFWYVVRRLST
jgi:hypothetical protein